MLLAMLFVGSAAPAQQPSAGANTTSKAAARLTPEEQQAVAAMHEFFRRTTRRLAEADLADIKSLADWQAKRPRLRKQILDMLGLDPLPAKTDLRAVVTGTIDAGEFVV